LAVHSDCPPLINVVLQLHFIIRVNHYGFFLSVQLHFTINLAENDKYNIYLRINNPKISEIDDVIERKFSEKHVKI